MASSGVAVLGDKRCKKPNCHDPFGKLIDQHAQRLTIGYREAILASPTHKTVKILTRSYRFSTFILFMALKKGSLVKAVREKLDNSVEALANDTRWSSYIFETWGEATEFRGDYVQVKFGAVPTPPIWLHKDQLEEKGE
jgi:hypothetical protein